MSRGFVKSVFILNEEKMWFSSILNLFASNANIYDFFISPEERNEEDIKERKWNSNLAAK